MTKNQKQRQQKKSAPKRAAPKRPVHGPVSMINTAPVAIGNSIRGSKPVVTNSSDGCRVVGRDFAFECKSTVAAATGWSLIGGMPITPAVLVTSALKSYAQLYSYFKVNKIVCHYITSSPTSQPGDILFYNERDRVGPMVDCTSNSFLPLVLSDPSTILGPQWQNHSMLMNPIKEFKSTNYGLSTDLSEDCAGSVFVYSKTSSANSPGYILIDYDITFKEMCVNPRAGLLPITRGLWNYLTLTLTATAVTLGVSSITPVISGNDPNGLATAIPSGAGSGDIYKVIFQVTNSTASGVNAAWTNVTAANLIMYDNTSGDVATAVDDGFTCYGVLSGTTTMFMYSTLDAAKTSGLYGRLTYGVTATITYSLCTLVSYVGSTNANLQSAY